MHSFALYSSLTVITCIAFCGNDVIKAFQTCQSSGYYGSLRGLEWLFSPLWISWAALMVIKFRAVSHINHSIAVFVLPHQAWHFQIQTDKLTGVSCISVCLVSISLDTGTRVIPRIQLGKPSRAKPPATQKPWAGAESQSTAWTNVRGTRSTLIWVVLGVNLQTLQVWFQVIVTKSLVDFGD